MLGLPDGVTACLFDLDGVLTPTAKVHAASWKQMFDEYLRPPGRAATGESFAPFDAIDDYDSSSMASRGTTESGSFLHSRGIELDEGGADDPPPARRRFTAWAIGRTIFS